METGRRSALSCARTILRRLSTRESSWEACRDGTGIAVKPNSAAGGDGGGVTPFHHLLGAGVGAAVVLGTAEIPEVLVAGSRMRSHLLSRSLAPSACSLASLTSRRSFSLALVALLQPLPTPLLMSFSAWNALLRRFALHPPTFFRFFCFFLRLLPHRKIARRIMMADTVNRAPMIPLMISGMIVNGWYSSSSEIPPYWKQLMYRSTMSVVQKSCVT